MPSHDKLAKKWTMPFVMQPINTRVVRRSNALLGNLYGESSRSIKRASVLQTWIGVRHSLPQQNPQQTCSL